jgi:hypothetical protein
VNQGINGLEVNPDVRFHAPFKLKARAFQNADMLRAEIIGFREKAREF